MQRVAVLGATGSIGQNTLDVIARHPDRFQVVGLTAATDVEGMAALAQRFDVRSLAMADKQAAATLQQRLGRGYNVEGGAAAVADVAGMDGVDTVVAGIVGSAGLLSCMAAVQRGRRVLLANKEALVCAGDVFMASVRANGAVLMPLDSEHNALFQCLPDGRQLDGLAASGVEKLVLTASGGPFRDKSLAELADVTPDQACAHPNWVMGRKISVDSATMMNKGLEVIEACWLFDARPEQVDVVVHPQSIVHSLVQYADGSVLAQLGSPDMRTPIAHALAYPARIEAGVKPLNLAEIAKLEFEEPDLRRFSCLALAYAALRQGGGAPAAMNAANEVAVDAFLRGRIGFMAIPRIIEETLSRDWPAVTDLASVLALDEQARRFAGQSMSCRQL